MRVGGHSNTYHTRTAEEAWAGIAAAGYKTVELSSVVGWTEHVDPRRARRSCTPASRTTASSRRCCRRTPT